MYRKPLVSVILVHYEAAHELFDCLDSIESSRSKTPYEIVVIDHDKTSDIEKTIRKRFPHAIYHKQENKGFGAGNNKGAEKAGGKYLFFLNPDTLVFSGTIDYLVSCFTTDNMTGVVAPFLLHQDGSVYDLQGSGELTPLQGIVCLSFLNKIFPNNPISRKYFLRDWNKKATQEVDVVPGTAFIIRADIFREIRGFDEKIFMYFEESDLCRRVRALGYRVYITPFSRLIHLGERSTHDRKKSKKVFIQSRFYYFRKHFGLFSAVAVEVFLRFYKICFAMIAVGFLYLLAILIQ